MRLNSRGGSGLAGCMYEEVGGKGREAGERLEGVGLGVKGFVGLGVVVGICMASESGMVLSLVEALSAAKVSSTVMRCVRSVLASLNSSWASSSGVCSVSGRSLFSCLSASSVDTNAD